MHACMHASQPASQPAPTAKIDPSKNRLRRHNVVIYFLRILRFGHFFDTVNFDLYTEIWIFSEISARRMSEPHFEVPKKK